MISHLGAHPTTFPNAVLTPTTSTPPRGSRQPQGTSVSKMLTTSSCPQFWGIPTASLRVAVERLNIAYVSIESVLARLDALLRKWQEVTL